MSAGNGCLPVAPPVSTRCSSASSIAANGRLFLPLNPPYGLRLDNTADAKRLYANIGAWLCRLKAAANAVGNPLAGYLLGPEEVLQGAERALAGAFALSPRRFQHGGLAITALAFAAPSE